MVVRFPRAFQLAGLALVLGLGACSRGQRVAQPSWAVFPLQRHEPHDGLAVVNQPDGYGLHIYLETDRTQAGQCQPRWLVDPARLFNGNGSHPFSSGVATRDEFFEVVGRDEVRRALQQELKALCLARAPQARWRWVDPPRSPAQVSPLALPALEEQHVLTNPGEEQARQEALLANPSQTTDSASRQ